MAQLEEDLGQRTDDSAQNGDPRELRITRVDKIGADTLPLVDVFGDLVWEPIVTSQAVQAEISNDVRNKVISLVQKEAISLGRPDVADSEITEVLFKVLTALGYTPVEFKDGTKDKTEEFIRFRAGYELVSALAAKLATLEEDIMFGTFSSPRELRSVLTKLSDQLHEEGNVLVDVLQHCLEIASDKGKVQPLMKRVLMIAHVEVRLHGQMAQNI